MLDDGLQVFHAMIDAAGDVCEESGGESIFEGSVNEHESQIKYMRGLTGGGMEGTSQS